MLVKSAAGNQKTRCWIFYGEKQKKKKKKENDYFIHVCNSPPSRAERGEIRNNK